LSVLTGTSLTAFAATAAVAAAAAGTTTVASASASASTAAVATITATATRAAACATALLFAGFVHNQRSAFERRRVEGANGVLRMLIRRHRHETETA
jgi:hypothetical protein